MPFILDLVLLALFCVPVFLGWKRGFFKSVLSLGRLALAFLVTVGLGSTAAGWLNDAYVYPAVYESVSEKLEGIADEVSSTAQNSAEALAEKIPAAFRPYLNTQSIDPSADVHSLAETWSRTVSERIAGVISTALGYFTVFILAFILLTVAVFAVGGLIRRIPLVRTVDRVLGLSLGILIGGVGTILLSAILAAILSVTGQIDVVESSLMLRLSEGVREMLFS